MLAPTRKDELRIQLQPLPGLDYLEQLWLELESRSNASFFQSWNWIGLWLRLICPLRHARLLTVHDGARLIGLGVFTARRRFFGLGPLHLRLHEVGNRALDNLTIEYNGVLTERGREREVLARVAAHLAEHDPRWLTLFVPGIDIDQVPLDRLRELDVDVRMSKHATHFIDLDALRASRRDYLSAVTSSKARGSVRRTARKLAAQYGEVSLTIARDAEQRRRFFHAMAALHQAYWTEKSDEHGAFGDPRILEFHLQLIAASGDREGAQLIRVDAGDQTMGYVYLMTWRGTAYFYQAGIDYPRFGGSGSPGLLVLTQAIQSTLDQGYSRFELMAGDVEYKRNLGIGEGKMVWLSLDRRGLGAHLRKAWWKLRDRINA